MLRAAARPPVGSPARQVCQRGDPAADPDAGRGDRRILAVPVQAVGPAQKVSRPVQALRPALPQEAHPASRVRLMARHPAAEPVSVQHQCPVRVESRDVHSARSRRDAAVSHRERPVRPEARSEDAAVLQAQSKAHRPVAWRPMVLREARRLALALRPEAEPRVQAAAAQSEQALPSEQLLVPVVPSAQQPVGAEAEPLARPPEVAQREARRVASVEPDVLQVEQDARQAASDALQAEQAVQQAALAEPDVLQVGQGAQQAEPGVRQAELAAQRVELGGLRVEEAQDVQPAVEVRDVRREVPEALGAQQEEARPSAAPSRLVLRLARRRTMMLRHAPEAGQVERRRSQSSSAGSVGCFSW